MWQAFDFLFHLSDTYIFGLLSLFSITISFIAILLVAKHFPLEYRYRDNSAIGNTSAVIGIIYAVLAGLIALYLMNQNASTEDAIQREANAASNIYRDSKWLPEPMRSNVRRDVKHYLHHVINIEWPLMKMGETVSDESRYIIDAIDKELFLAHQTNTLDLLMLHHLLEEIKTLYSAREQRVNLSYEELSPELWEVILIATILILGINFLFGMNYYLHIVSIVAIAIMVSSVLFLLITLDRPFQGEFAVDSGILEAAERYIEHEEQQAKK